MRQSAIYFLGSGIQVQTLRSRGAKSDIWKVREGENAKGGEAPAVVVDAVMALAVAFVILVRNRGGWVNAILASGGASSTVPAHDCARPTRSSSSAVTPSAVIDRRR